MAHIGWPDVDVLRDPSPTDPGELIHEPDDLDDAVDDVPVLPLREAVVFPQSLMPLSVGRAMSLQAVETAMAEKKTIGTIMQFDPNLDQPGAEDLYSVGTLCRIVRVMKYPNETMMVLVQGLARFRVTEFTQQDPYLAARVDIIESTPDADADLDAVVKNMMARFEALASVAPDLSTEVLPAIQEIDDHDSLVDAVSAHLDIAPKEKQSLLLEDDIEERLLKLTRLLERELEFHELGTKIETEVQGELERGVRERYLREKLAAIRRELGEDENPELAELRGRVEDAKMPKEVKKEANRELERLAEIHPSSPEYTVARTYLDWLVELPWRKRTRDRLDIDRARRILDEDHHDLEKVKERILEYLAVLQLRAAQRKRTRGANKRDLRGPIFCFVGPPGVGKTSLGQSIARALKREFVRMSLGGVRDEAEIRGHRRTYIGALPGRIVQGLRRAGTKNPVFMLDEIDKLSADFRGDPSSALLEVLDPEQNNSFQDHYLDVPFDLSEVLFIATANITEPIPPALLDRMELLELPGYSEEDKLAIAQGFLVPRQLREHGFRDDDIAFEDGAIRTITSEYTHEAGVRNLEREIARVLRKLAVKAVQESAENRANPHAVNAKQIRELLGPPKHFPELAERVGRSGVAVGLVVTRVGGDIVFIEATKMKGDGELILTGHLGEVMKESARAALSYLRSRADELAIDPEFFDRYDIHIHVPAGAIPKDGPSAGITIAAALASLLTDTPLKPDMAMTGEITLRGKVLPVGGIRDKVLAAHRAGVKTVILPDRNESELTEVPQTVRDDLAFVYAETIDDVFAAALPIPSASAAQAD